MNSRIATKTDAISFSLKYFGVASALLTGALAWDFFSSVPWAIFFALLAFASAVPWGLLMWHLVWRSHSTTKVKDDSAA
jgi:hypothetical protein